MCVCAYLRMFICVYEFTKYECVIIVYVCVCVRLYVYVYMLYKCVYVCLFVFFRSAKSLRVCLYVWGERPRGWKKEMKTGQYNKVSLFTFLRSAKYLSRSIIFCFCFLLFREVLIIYMFCLLFCVFYLPRYLGTLRFLLASLFLCFFSIILR